MNCRDNFRVSCLVLVLALSVLQGAVSNADTAAGAEQSEGRNEPGAMPAIAGEGEGETGGATDAGGTKGEDEAVVPPQGGVLRVIVLEDSEEDIPISNARVIVSGSGLSPVFTLTDQDGIAVLSGLPLATVEVDVTAPRRKAVGGRVDLDRPEVEQTFRLKRLVLPD